MLRNRARSRWLDGPGGSRSPADGGAVEALCITLIQLGLGVRSHGVQRVALCLAVTGQRGLEVARGGVRGGEGAGQVRVAAQRRGLGQLVEGEGAARSHRFGEGPARRLQIAVERAPCRFVLLVLVVVDAVLAGRACPRRVQVAHQQRTFDAQPAEPSAHGTDR